MARFTATVFAAIMAAASLVSAEGYMELENGCSKPVYYTVVDQHGVVSTGELGKSGSITQGHHINYGGENDGVSVKLCFTKNCANPYQFETTVSKGVVYYDWSAINGDPFKPYGSSIIEVNGNHNCPKISCKAGDDSCAFHSPGETYKIKGCSSNSILQAQLCRS